MLQERQLLVVRLRGCAAAARQPSPTVRSNCFIASFGFFGSVAVISFGDSIHWRVSAADSFWLMPGSTLFPFRSPVPSWPWHFQHFVSSKVALPAATLAGSGACTALAPRPNGSLSHNTVAAHRTGDLESRNH
jgi:hypothetical protein